MRRLLLVLALALALPVRAGTTIVGSRDIIGNWDASAANTTKPFKVGASLPVACVVGELFFDTAATAGQNVYACTATDVWTVEGDGTGAGGSVTGTGTSGTMTKFTGSSSIGDSNMTEASGVATLTGAIPGLTAVDNSGTAKSWSWLFDDTSARLVDNTASRTVATFFGSSGRPAFFLPVPIASGGTNGTVTPVIGGVAFGVSGAYSFTAAGTSGQVLTSAGAGTPTWASAVTSVATGVGLTGGTITTTGTVALKYSDTLAADPALGAGECVFASGTAERGLVCEGATADTIEMALKFPDPASSDKTLTLPNETGTVCSTGSVCSGYQAGPLTGDGTTSGAAFTLANIPTATPAAGSLLFTTIAAPSTPAAGKGSVYVDSTSKNLAVKDDAGVVKHGAQTKAAVTSNFLTALNDAGSFTAAQPAFSDVSGAATDAQVPDSITIDLAAAATALAANGANCSGNNFALGVDASGVGECAQPAFSNLSGAATDGQIPNTITIDQATLSLATNALKSATTTVDVSAATAPSTGQVLTATDSTHATWQAGGGSQNLFATIDASSGTDPVADTATDTLIVTGTAPVVVTGDSSADSLVLSMAAATSSVNGYLTSADWTTFNGKQAGPLTGDVTTSGAAAAIGNDKITESMLKAVDSPSDEECLTYESTVGDFEWQSCGSGSSAFSALTGSTNTTAAMVVGTGASLAVSGSGTIAATTAANIANNTGTTTTVLHGNASGAPSFGAIAPLDIAVTPQKYDVPLATSGTTIAWGTTTSDQVMNGRRSAWGIPNIKAATSLVGVGMSNPLGSGLGANGADSTRNYVTLTTTTTANSLAYVSDSNFVRGDWSPRFTALLKTPATITLQRIAVQMTELASTATPVIGTASNSAKYAGVVYDATVNSGKWMCCSGDGGTHGCTDMGVTVAASTVYVVDADWSIAGTLTCRVGTEANIHALTVINKTTNLPTASASAIVNAMVIEQTLTTAIRTLSVARIQVEEN